MEATGAYILFLQLIVAILGILVTAVIPKRIADKNIESLFLNKRADEIQVYAQSLVNIGGVKFLEENGTFFFPTDSYKNLIGGNKKTEWVITMIVIVGIHGENTVTPPIFHFATSSDLLSEMRVALDTVLGNDELPMVYEDVLKENQESKKERFTIRREYTGYALVAAILNVEEWRKGKLIPDVTEKKTKVWMKKKTSVMKERFINQIKLS